ncbi:DUF4439 domain-containing protein [Georgenia yuyongxinii]|uniref:DUF4439 domain-containing protein n=1 Tax=Georgenia yuyongxinii TaxID=2589797 RepID=A0A5B8C178_9MICO|nr:DUF4439 domain-containing protein [Georgenia yuyongxinii]QDC24274.1 DUF4439 domain-containing protein [Georgenia yuyongxinii]
MRTPALTSPADHVPVAVRGGARRRRRVLAAAAAAALLAGCGAVRLDTPPTLPASPDAAEVARQDEAVRAATIEQTVLQVTADDADAGLLQEVRAHAEAHTDALGGVWVAWPEGAPEDVATPEVSTAAPTAEPTASDVLALLTAGAGSAREAALTADDDAVAAAMLAISLSRSADAADLAAATGAEAPASSAAPLTPEALLARGADGPTVLVLDSARFALETVAARSDGGARERATARAAYLQELVDTALAAGAPDPREGAYDLSVGEVGRDAAGGVPGDGAATTDPALTAEQAVAVAAEERLVRHWTFSLGLVGPHEREALVAAAEDAAEQVRAWGGRLPALPGIG